jgi:diaminopimelate decarboxylase
MGDNPRPALYGAEYAALLPHSPTAASTGPATVVGRYCESGDVLIRITPLPPVEAGALICVPVVGAYQLSMASNYNLVPRPAAIMVGPGGVQLLTRRETTADLLQREVFEPGG